METLLPFGFPTSTALYLALYLVTLVLHVVFMNYTLAGTAYLAVGGILRRSSDGAEASWPVYNLLRDWMPFMLSAAITAGVAPLLFVQVLYERSFYTANLLLFHRWMAILPALMVGFYLLYLLKSDLVRRLPRPVTWFVGLGSLACFAFTGWSWTENHLLSLDRAIWVEQYASGRLLYRSPELAPRLTLWFVGAAPTMALLVGWQLRHAALHGRATTAPRQLAWLALLGLTASAAAGYWYYTALSEELREKLLGPLALPWLVVATVGWGIEVMAWMALAKSPTWSKGWLVLASTGCLVAIFGMTAVREARRLLAIDVSKLFQVHEQAAGVGGLGAFLTFFALNALAITACVLIVGADCGAASASSRAQALPTIHLPSPRTRGEGPGVRGIL